MAGVGISETRVKVPDMYAVIAGILQTYGAGVADAVEETSKIVAKDVAKQLRKAGDFNGGKEYRRGWDVHGKRVVGLGGLYTVYNKTKPGLSHLLEFGHVKANGGRTRAFNFIQPIVDTLEDDFRNTFVDVMADKI